MLKKSTILILLLFPILFLKFSGVAYASSAKGEANYQIEAKQIDRQAEILTNYFAQFDSPLQYHAQDFIDASKTYHVDWKLVPAIAGVESTFGKFIPGGYNAWGWGVYGTQAIYFNSWRDAIFTVTKGLRDDYLDKGLTDPYSMNSVYAASPYWGGHVSYFLSDLAKFEQDYKGKHPLTAEVNPSVKIAALSGQLAFIPNN